MKTGITAEEVLKDLTDVTDGSALEPVNAASVAAALRRAAALVTAGWCKGSYHHGFKTWGEVVDQCCASGAIYRSQPGVWWDGSPETVKMSSAEMLIAQATVVAFARYLVSDWDAEEAAAERGNLLSDRLGLADRTVARWNDAKWRVGRDVVAALTDCADLLYIDPATEVPDGI